ncbi:unnamed protein product, partial [marine sediment metagenome]
MRKLIVILLSVMICLLGVSMIFAQETKVYPTLTEYEQLTGKTIEKFNEAPVLKTKVAEGILPPVEERLPGDPPVLEPLEEIGQYGGRLI